MTQTTLKKAIEELGLTPDDPVRLYIKNSKGIIEASLLAFEREVESAAVHDLSEDYLSDDEVRYYPGLK